MAKEALAKHGSVSFGQSPEYYEPTELTFHKWQEQTNQHGKTYYIQGEKNSSGEWHGKVSKVFKDHGVVIGYLRNGEWNGPVTRIDYDGEKYVGNKKDNCFNGPGNLMYRNGNNYVGNFLSDNFNGAGTYYFANGDKFVGWWKDDDKDGLGVLCQADGTIKSQTWEKGVLKKES